MITFSKERIPQETRVDRQGNWSNEERVDRAMQNFIADMDFTSATYMESCIHCGLCAEACHYYVQTGDPTFTPIWKLEPFKQAYKREMGPLSFFYKLFNFKRRVSGEELESWQFLLYDACSLCGRCSLVCPMGIDIASMIGIARHGMFAAGLIPHEMWELAERAEHDGSPFGATPQVLKESIQALEEKHRLKIPMDRDSVDVMVTVSAIELNHYPDSIADMARVMNHLGISWTIRSEGYEATNFGMLSGNIQWQRDMSRRIIDAASACRAKVVIVPECGNSYTALRWQAADMCGKDMPFRVLHISEYLAETIENGQLKVKAVQESVTFHDPCQISRRGGATEAPRKILAALGVEFHELPGGGEMNWCCGGGGGVMNIHRADELRYRNFELKMDQVNQSGADVLYTSCANCRANIEDCSEHFHWRTETKSLLGLVAKSLYEE